MAAYVLLLVAVAFAGCSKKPPVTQPTQPRPVTTATPPTPEPTPAEPVTEAPIVTPNTLNDDAISARSLDDLNRDSPFKPVFFGYDTADLDADGQAVLNGDAAILEKHPTWIVTIEGHCDERGTPEYNLALGEQRAVAAKAYLVSLGIDGERLRTVSYGKEFPFDPAHTEAAWAQNRRAHFVITAK